MQTTRPFKFLAIDNSVFIKKLIIGLVTMDCTIFCAAGFALYGEGTVEEIQECSISNAAYKNFMLYRLSDGNWFAAYGHYHNGSTTYPQKSRGQRKNQGVTKIKGSE